MQIAARIGTMARRGAPLPYDAEVEWIESPERNKSKYLINTGFVPTTLSKIEIRLLATLDGWQYNGCGGNGNQTKFRIRNNTKTSVTIDFGSEFYAGSVREFAPIVIDAKNSRCEVDGVVHYFEPTSFAGGVQDFCLFAVKIDSGYIDYPSAQKLKSFKAWEDDALVQDFIAIRFTNENGVSEGAMYDRVSGQLFRNAGSDAFVIGPDK